MKKISKLFLIFSALLLPACREAPVWDDLKECRFFYSTQGAFHDRAPSDINLMNAEVRLSDKSEPKSLPISEGLIRALNDRNTSVLRQVLTSLGISATTDPEKYSQWKKEARPILEGRGDKDFKIDVQIDGGNDVGGSYGGFDIRLRLESLHRSADIIYGEAKETVPIADSEEGILKNLEQTYQRVVKKAFEDLKGRLDGEKKMPRARLRLVLNTEGLNPKQSAYVTEALFPCLYDLGSSLFSQRHVMSEPHLMHLNLFDIEYRLKKFDPSETQEAYLRKYAEQIRFETGAHGKHRCSSWRTPLEGLKTVVQEYPDENRIVVIWGR